MAPSYEGRRRGRRRFGSGQGYSADASSPTSSRRRRLRGAESRRHKADGKLRGSRRWPWSACGRPRGRRFGKSRHAAGVLASAASISGQRDGFGSARSLSDARGVAVATCCHHRCEWSSYVAITRAKIGGSAAISRGSRGGRPGRARSRTARRESTRRWYGRPARQHRNRSARSSGAKPLVGCGAPLPFAAPRPAGARSAYCDVELSPHKPAPRGRAVRPVRRRGAVVRKSPCSPVLPRKFEEGVCGCVVI